MKNKIIAFTALLLQTNFSMAAIEVIDATVSYYVNGEQTPNTDDPFLYGWATNTDQGLWTRSRREVYTEDVFGRPTETYSSETSIAFTVTNDTAFTLSLSGSSYELNAGDIIQIYSANISTDLYRNGLLVDSYQMITSDVSQYDNIFSGDFYSDDIYEVVISSSLRNDASSLAVYGSLQIKEVPLPSSLYFMLTSVFGLITLRHNKKLQSDSASSHDFCTKNPANLLRS